jgi:hypothetical protein
LANPVVVVTLAGASAFLATWLAQNTFYREFGVDPEEVGLSYPETLTRAGAGLIAQLVPILAVTLSLYWLLNYLEPRLSRSHLDVDQSRRENATAVVVACVLVAPLALLILLPWSYRESAEQVKAGRNFRPASNLWDARNNWAGLHVERVYVSWIDGTKRGYDFGTEEVMYLGRASGVAVFYDRSRNRTVRVPEDSVVIERVDRSRSPESMGPGGEPNTMTP